MFSRFGPFECVSLRKLEKAGTVDFEKHSAWKVGTRSRQSQNKAPFLLWICFRRVFRLELLHVCWKCCLGSVLVLSWALNLGSFCGFSGVCAVGFRQFLLSLLSLSLSILAWLFLSWGWPGFSSFPPCPCRQDLAGAWQVGAHSC